MTNLVPGSLFHTPGLNRNHTPTPNTVTPRELDKIYARQSFNGHSWPPDSPVPRVYDVSNTSTRMILLNNKNHKASRLRGYDETEYTRSPDPGRHSRASSAKNPRAHRKCFDSSSPYFAREVETSLDWLNNNDQRTQTLDTTSMKSFSTYRSATSMVNPKRHTACRVSNDPPEFTAGMSSPILRRRRYHPPRSSMIFNYPEMAPGEKLYLWSMERIYSAKNLMALKKDQYLQLLQQNSRGVHSFHEYLKYMNYIKRPKTSPTPKKTGWSKPMSPAKAVHSVESTKENSVKQQTSRPSSEVSQKSQSDQSQSSKSKKEITQEKSESHRVGVSTAQAATGLWSPPRSKQNSIRSRNGSARSQTSSETEREKDANAKDKPKEAMENKDKEEEVEKEEDEVSGKLSFSGDDNEEKKEKHNEGGDRPLSRRGRASPNGSDQEGQKETDVKQDTAAEELDQTIQEHDSRPSTVLSIHENAWRPESGKSTTSKDKAIEVQSSINEVEEKKSKSSNKAESLVSIKSNDNQSISRVRKDSADITADRRASEGEHRVHRDSGAGEESPGEGEKEIHGTGRELVENEDDTGGVKRDGIEINGTHRDSFDADDDIRGNRDVDSIEY